MGLLIQEQLGYGVHGIVFAAKNQTDGERLAVKVHEREKEYGRERDVYLRIGERGVTDICSCHVPELMGFDDELLVIVMSVVKPPYVLDFAGAYLDHRPDFSEEVLADWRAEKAEQFGADWPKVQVILREFEFLGIYIEDISPANICFR
jgi:hypothetical protein